MAKDFLNIAELTRHFADITKDLGKSRNIPVAEANAICLLEAAQMQLAIAQQLSVISGHLGRLVELCENNVNRSS